MWKDSETIIDYLDYEYLVSSVQNIICNDKLLPASIGIYGDWGSGKSSLMRMCQSTLEEKDKNIKCIYFNGWLFESYEDAKTALLSSIIDEIKEDERFSSKVKDIIEGLNESIDKFKVAQFALKAGLSLATNGGVGTLLGITIGSAEKKIAEAVSDIDAERAKSIGDNVKDRLDKKELRESIRKFQGEFDKLIETSKMSRLVIFIDELDRCRPDTILDTLEAMKLFMFTGKVAFVIGADERHITYAVKNKFSDIEGIQINIGKEYMEKLIQYPIRIPRMDVFETETYIASLLLEDIFDEKNLKEIMNSIREEANASYLKSEIPFLLKHDKIKSSEKAKMSLSVVGEVSGILSAGLHGNPRQVKRFLNTMDMRIEQAKYKKTELERSVLVKIMLLEYIKPSIFSKFAELNFEGKLQGELQLLEGGEQKAEILLDRMKDEWFLKWISISPKLSDIDLSKYFYFARTSLDEKISRISKILSPTAQQILDSIIQESELALTEALKNDISNAEAANIIEGFGIRVSSFSKISNKKVEYFIKFVNEHEGLYHDALDCIGNFSCKQIESGSIVHFANMSSKANLVNEMKAVIDRWDQEGGENKFGKLFDNALKTLQEK